MSFKSFIHSIKFMTYGERASAMGGNQGQGSGRAVPTVIPMVDIAEGNSDVLAGKGRVAPLCGPCVMVDVAD